MKINELRKLLITAWCAETAKGKWREDVPSMNQCAVTALVVQDYFGGDLMRRPLNDGDSHYWNRLPNGEEIDLTYDQFFYTQQYDVGGAIIRTREYVLSYPDTKLRYELLKKRVEDEISKTIQRR